jgi:hypothetical protein
MQELLDNQATRPASDAAAACLNAGEARLSALLARGATDRTSALDLLAVDALVSYAFEAAAEEPASLEQIATNAMQRIAELPEVP